MRPLYQLIVAVALLIATGVGILRIAQAKNEGAVGGEVFRLESGRAAELAAFVELRRRLDELGDHELADRIENLRQDGSIWIAPQLDPSRWAVFVDTFSLVRRIYVRRVALIEPRAQLFAKPRPDVPREWQTALAWVTLGGALHHEIAHYNGVLDEAEAYDREVAWYRSLYDAPFFLALKDERLRMFEWVVESAVVNAQQAKVLAGG